MREIHNGNRQHGQIDREKLQLRAASRRPLPAEGEVPLARRLERPFGGELVWACLKALQESAEELDGRLFTVCLNLHSEEVGFENALRAHEEAVFHLARGLWVMLDPIREGKGNSFLSKAARGCRPLSVYVPAVQEGIFHTHGVLMIPKKVGRRVHQSRLIKLLSTFQAGSRMLHDDAVHLAPILAVDKLRSVAEYMTRNTETLSPDDRTIMFAPYGRHVAEDWRPINRRIDELVSELGKLDQLSAHRRAVRKNHLVETTWEFHRKSSPVRTGRAGRRRRAPGLVPVPKRPTEPVRLPPTMGHTGIVRWVLWLSGHRCSSGGLSTMCCVHSGHWVPNR